MNQNYRKTIITIRNFCSSKLQGSMQIKIEQEFYAKFA